MAHIFSTVEGWWSPNIGRHKKGWELPLRLHGQYHCSRDFSLGLAFREVGSSVLWVVVVDGEWTVDKRDSMVDSWNGEFIVDNRHSMVESWMRTVCRWFVVNKWVIEVNGWRILMAGRPTTTGCWGSVCQAPICASRMMFLHNIGLKYPVKSISNRFVFIIFYHSKHIFNINIKSIKIFQLNLLEIDSCLILKT